MLCGCGVSDAIGAATPSITSAHTSVPTPTTLAKPGGKLSVRLEMLTRSPALWTVSLDEQARALNLPAHGPGSLTRDAQGRILVNIRTTDLSANGLQKLRDLGAVITTVSERYQVVTAFVAIADLSAIGDLSAVQSVEEELGPGSGSGAVFPTPQ